jgi:hypothetical protein
MAGLPDCSLEPPVEQAGHDPEGNSAAGGGTPLRRCVGVTEQAGFCFTPDVAGTQANYGLCPRAHARTRDGFEDFSADRCCSNCRVARPPVLPTVRNVAVSVSIWAAWTAGRTRLGAAGGDRTHDPWLRRPILYPLSYSRVIRIGERALSAMREALVPGRIGCGCDLTPQLYSKVYFTPGTRTSHEQ